ncbi:unnamed protein product [Ceutorhynchus assimilis]|uniref:HPS5-like beta-propeller domain-containing protein n=1 Tax=Ceutorhynchus assimilis TaxID=467358 RepID=A0A9P0DGT5_9CUCU|nr:unnamed protein product [Ceutorhynchus assimilis]
MAQQNNTAFLREWAPLSDLFDKLPAKTGGLFSQDIKLTCIDALSEFLVIGTNVGTVYWYNRKRKDLQRLRCENSNSPITFIKAVSTVDYMVASGNQSGNISIFQIPKSHPDSLPDALKPQQKQVERYTVTDLHKCPITALEWSKNGMKLFSGDKTGIIVLTELDFYMHVCKSIEILNESYEVVQLSYRQQHLMVSTTFRSIICQHLDKWKVCQVGKKDRKVLGKFGGLIYQRGFKPNDVVLYCMRPGLRIWIADVEGEVQKTLLFKDLLCKDCAQIPILNPLSKTLQQLKPQKEASFGVVQQFCDNLLITYSNDVVYILDPANMSILATVNNLRSILGIATYKDELFILEEERSLLRISYHPEDSILGEMVDVNLDSIVISNAEEAQEIVKDEPKTFDEISKQEFDDSILFKNTRKLKKKIYSNSKAFSRETNNEVDLSYTRPTLMNLSAVGVLPDLRSPESIVNDIENKEKILSDVLNLEKLTIRPPQDEQLEVKDSIKSDILLCPVPEIESRIIGSGKEWVPKTITQIVTVPNDWNIASLQTSSESDSDRKSHASSSSIPITRKNRHSSSANDSSLSDWEIV